MKVRFNSPRETHPSKDAGLEVLYAPARRQSFKLRWYLILALVASPFVFFAFKIAHGYFIKDMPAEVLVPGSEVRARDAAQVKTVHVREGESVKTGQLLMEFDNPEWQLRLEQLEALVQASRDSGDISSHSVQGVLDAQLKRAEERLALVKRLVEQGAATQGELAVAASERDQRLLDRLAFEEQETRQRVQTSDKRQLSQYLSEIEWLKSRIASLKVVAPGPGVVTGVLVGPGENVGPGTPVVSIRNAGKAEIVAYIDLSDASKAQAGQPLCLKFPDGEIVRGKVGGAPRLAEQLPQGLRDAFSAHDRDLVVTVVLEEPLPTRWMIQNLPLQARFKCGWWLDVLW